MKKMHTISRNGQFIKIDETTSIELDTKTTASLILPENIIVVLDWMEYSPINQNVKCFDYNGNLIWNIDPGDWPEERDCPVTGIWLDDNKIMVYRSCGFEQEIDLKNGKELRCEFTK
ncbi:MAG: hypothetical protein HRT58_00155 [Crocinitomicaceae bacterium]|nr:hypothetical protein [Flavobacteriales bacterium]NQZ34032.1 hypothetical protein [Crocinitomicaceae bacterium]